MFVRVAMSVRHEGPGAGVAVAADDAQDPLEQRVVVPPAAITYPGGGGTRTTMTSWADPVRGFLGHHRDACPLPHGLPIGVERGADAVVESGPCSLVAWNGVISGGCWRRGMLVVCAAVTVLVRGYCCAA